MRKQLIVLLSVLLVPLYFYAQDHIDLFVSKSNNTFNTYQGQNGKATDEHEKGSVTIRTEGPIKWSVEPNELEIGPNQNKNWTGKVWGDVDAAPEPGKSVEGKIIGHYDVTYSRPSGGGGAGNVVSTYTCKKCPTHPDGGEHEIVNVVDDHEISVTIYSISVVIVGDPKCVNGQVTLEAQAFPGGDGIIWDTPFGQFSGPTLSAPVPAGFMGGNIRVTYTVEGVSTSAVKFMPPNTGTLNGFVTTQMCIGEKTTAPAVTQALFAGPGDGGGCPASNLVYAPFDIAPSLLLPVIEIPLSVTSGNVTKNTSIQAVNKDKTVTHTFALNPGGGILENIESAFTAVLSGTGSPCQKSGSWAPAGQFSTSSFDECCITFIKGQTKYEGQLNWAPAINCRFPFAGIPYVASVDFLLNAGITIAISVNSTTQCQGNDKICANASATASLGAGIGGTVLGGLATADLTVVVDGITGNVEYCFSPPPRKGKMNANLGKVKVVGTLTGFWGLASYSVDYPILDGYTTPDFEF